MQPAPVLLVLASTPDREAALRTRLPVGCRSQQRDGFAEGKAEVCQTAKPTLPKGRLRVPKGRLRVPKGRLQVPKGRLPGAKIQTPADKRQTDAVIRMTGAVRRRAGAAEGQTRRLMGRLAVKTGTAD